jgi:hypothetical protein
MKTNIVLLGILTAYFFALRAVYTVWSIIDTQAVEWIGTWLLVLSGVLTIFIAFFLQIQLKNQGGDLPEDVLEANVDDGDPELGFFQPLELVAGHSWQLAPQSLSSGLPWASGSPITRFRSS